LFLLFDVDFYALGRLTLAPVLIKLLPLRFSDDYLTLLQPVTDSLLVSIVFPPPLLFSVDCYSSLI